MKLKSRRRRAGQPTTLPWKPEFLEFFPFAGDDSTPPDSLRVVQSARGLTLSGRFEMASGVVATLTTRVAQTGDGADSRIVSEQMKVHFISKAVR